MRHPGEGGLHARPAGRLARTHARGRPPRDARIRRLGRRLAAFARARVRRREERGHSRHGAGRVQRAPRAYLVALELEEAHHGELDGDEGLEREEVAVDRNRRPVLLHAEGLGGGDANHGHHAPDGCDAQARGASARRRLRARRIERAPRERAGRGRRANTRRRHKRRRWRAGGARRGARHARDVPAPVHELRLHIPREAVGVRAQALMVGGRGMGCHVRAARAGASAHRARWPERSVAASQHALQRATARLHETGRRRGGAATRASLLALPATRRG